MNILAAIASDRNISPLFRAALAPAQFEPISDECAELLHDIAQRQRRLPSGFGFVWAAEFYSAERLAEALSDDADALIWILYAQPGEWLHDEIVCVDLDAWEAV